LSVTSTDAEVQMSGAKAGEREILVVGSGPGGATVARQLALAGKQVLILERGRDWRRSRVYGTYLGALLYADRRSLLFTPEGLNIIRPLMVGGATSMYCGCAALPNPWWKERYGIDLEEEAGETVRELGIGPLPPELRGEASTRIAEAAGELGMHWQPQAKFLRPERADPFDCGARCMLGCRCGAKWSAAEYVDQAVAAGAELWTRAFVDRVRVEDGAVRGVSGRRKGRPFELTAPTVVVAAGGIGTPVLLRRSGLESAGRGMAMDTTVMVYGAGPFEGIGGDPPMTWSHADEETGVLYSTLIDPWLTYPLVMVRKGPLRAMSWPRWSRTLGVMIKLTDEISGGIDPDGTVRKGLTEWDRVRLEGAERVAGEILRKAGCSPDTIVTTPVRGTHPSATARIDEVVDRNLETEVAGLHVCDASVFPEALGRPTVVTIVALARRLAAHLAGPLPRRSSSPVHPGPA
jgi:choline dehydrogenase-like flavoprotein